MRAALIAAASAATLLVGCERLDRDVNAEDRDVSAATATIADPVQAFVARYPAPVAKPGDPPAASPLALFYGAYEVRNDCLVFVMEGNEPALPIFSVDTPVRVMNDRVIIDGTTHMFGTPGSRGGGMGGRDSYANLVELPPEDCRYSVIG